MRTRAGIVLQARVGSTRLYGKALEAIGGRTLIEHCLYRLIQAGVARVVLATTTRPEDDVLDATARRLGASVFRGDADDVLTRVSDAARAYGLDPVLRATGDNPAVDVQAPGRLLAVLRSSGADYVRESGLPHGAAVEAMTAAALHRAAALATSAYDREHVTTFIRSNPGLFTVVTVDAPAPLVRPALSLTVDTRDELERVRELFARTQSEEPSLSALIAASGGRVSAYAPTFAGGARGDTA